MVFLTTQFRRQVSRASSSSSIPVESQQLPSASDSHNTQFVPEETGLRRFTYAEIKSATRNFNHSFLIGRGGFGIVYRGTINHGGRMRSVAIKMSNRESIQRASEFRAEIEMLSMVRHCNIVSLIGYCMEREDMILVYEFMPNGTLHDRLHYPGTGNGTLTWAQRIKICLGIAQGLFYLHDFTGIDHAIVHRDIKTSNILLDDNLTPKITDFGLSRIVLKNDDRNDITTTIVVGTPGYLDPEYFETCKLTEKSDVYSFGVILLEVLSGRKPIDRDMSGEHKHIVGWALSHIRQEELVEEQLVDSIMRGDILPECLKEFVRIVVKCVQPRSDQRPTMAQVVASLISVVALQERSVDDDQSLLASLGAYSDVDTEEEYHEYRHGEEDVSHDEEVAGSSNMGNILYAGDQDKHLDEEAHLHNDRTQSHSDQHDLVENQLIYQNGIGDSTSTVSDSRAFSWRGHCVSQSASRLLHLVEEQYPQTFQYLKIRREKVWEVYLEAFEHIMARFLSVVVADLTEEIVLDLRSELEELVGYGFDLTWALEWLDSAARFCDVESLKKELSKLEEDTANLNNVIERLEQEISAAKLQRTETAHLRDVKAEELARRLVPGQELMHVGCLALDLLPGY